jgi:hypothetical protein
MPFLVGCLKTQNDIGLEQKELRFLHCSISMDRKSTPGLQDMARLLLPGSRRMALWFRHGRAEQMWSSLMIRSCRS